MWEGVETQSKSQKNNQQKAKKKTQNTQYLHPVINYFDAAVWTFFLRD